MKNKSLSLFALSALALASTASAETYTYAKDGYVLENSTIQNTLLWQGGGADGTGNIYVKGENSILGEDGYSAFKISGSGGADCDANFVFDDGASISFAKNAMDFNGKYTDISYSVATEGASAKIILQGNQDIATSTNPADATDTRTITIGKGVTLETANTIWVKADTTNTSSKIVVNGNINTTGTLGSNGRVIWDINGNISSTSDFSDNLDEGGSQVTIDNGGSVTLRNMVLRTGSSLNIKNGTASLNRLTTDTDVDSTISIGAQGKLNVKTAITLSNLTNFTVDGEVSANTFETTLDALTEIFSIVSAALS